MSNREERRKKQQELTKEEKSSKRVAIRDNLIIFLLIVSLFTNIALTYSITNLNNVVTNFISDVLGYSPVYDANIVPTDSSGNPTTVQPPKTDWFGKPVTETPTTPNTEESNNSNNTSGTPIEQPDLSLTP